jgi:hypothetical protein
MKLLLVTFALRNPYRDYTPFFVALRGNALNWWHYIDQTCVVSTLHDVDSFARLLFPHMETTDSVLVVEMPPHQFQGFLPQAAWDWLNATSDAIVSAPPSLTSGFEILPSAQKRLP